ncbi:IS110 family transposase [Parabacteroides sp. FAFU027]|uniref:IS110 family transposase n=1 Tax=Parabacteroides sp. FAFU027 TaxID=2922715 RepID=UPI001FAEABD0|nr:IS110 family transposase [Parabacteroides sp. FAFU027]
MVTPVKYSVGLDCSKEEFVAAMSLFTSDQKITVKATRKFKNTAKGFSDCDHWICQHKKVDVAIVLTMEATGNYHENLAYYFYNQGYIVSIVLPNKSKKYMQSLGLKSKNDTIDAKGLSQMGAEQRLPAWEPFSPSVYELRALTRFCEQLSMNRTQLMNQLSSMEYGMFQVEEVKNSLLSLIQLIETQIAETKVRIKELINKDEKIRERYDKISPIKGLGPLTFATIIAETNGFKLFENERQLTSYAGYDIVENQSGKRVGKTKISKKGNSHIRRIMHMASLNVVKYGEPKFVNLYNRIMSKTTIKMKAYVAIQRKLLCLTYILWKRNEAYDANYEAKQSNPGIDKKVGGINPPTQDKLSNIAVGSPLSIPQI